MNENNNAPAIPPEVQKKFGECVLLLDRERIPSELLPKAFRRHLIEPLKDSKKHGQMNYLKFLCDMGVEIENIQNEGRHRVIRNDKHRMQHKPDYEEDFIRFLHNFDLETV